MANFCIPPNLLEQTKKIVTSSNSIERNKKLTELFSNSDVAKQMNDAYEKSLLLKNQNRAIDKFLANFTKEGQAAKDEMKKKIQERLLNRKERIRDEELLSLAQDIFNRKYKIDIPLEQVQLLNDLKKQVDALDNPAGRALNETGGSAYGDAVASMKRVIENLKEPTNTMTIKDTLTRLYEDTALRFKGKTPFEKSVEGVKVAGDIAAAGVYKSLEAAADMSYSFRQGMKVLATNPKVWKSNWISAFEPFKTMSKAEQELLADKFVSRMVSHPLYEDAIKSGLSIGVVEDFFPTTLAEKIPAVGSIFKASNEAFTIFSQGSRMGLFEDMVTNARALGKEVTPQMMKDFATVANSITGRGNWKWLQTQHGLLNKLFFSARFIESNIDTFVRPFDTSLDPLARAEATKSSLRVFGILGALLYTASLFTDVETDPRSSKFGKAKVGGNTYVDLTGGLGSYITLGARLGTQQSKSATSGKITELNSGKFGSRTIMDVITDFTTNKFAPVPSTLVQFAKGKDFQNNKPTLTSATKNLVTPISFGNAWDLFSNNDASTALMGTVADLLGSSATDYNKFKRSGQ